MNVMHMPPLMDIILLKEQVNDGTTNVYYLIFEKSLMMIILFIILMTGVAIGLPPVGIGILVGTSLGPIVYGHYYLNYIRRPRKQQKFQGDKPRHRTKE